MRIQNHGRGSDDLNLRNRIDQPAGFSRGRHERRRFRLDAVNPDARFEGFDGAGDNGRIVVGGNVDPSVLPGEVPRMRADKVYFKDWTRVLAEKEFEKIKDDPRIREFLRTSRSMD